MFISRALLGGLFLAWCIGANNGANVFGTAVATMFDATYFSLPS